MSRFLEIIKQRTLLCDGAMGTQLQAAGLLPGECGDAWNIDHPDRVLAVQKAYVDAGSECLTTNTFSACAISLARHGLAGQVKEINQAAVRIAREAFGEKPGFVLGDIGPFGGLLEPYGTEKASDVRDAFVEQAGALVEAGVDALLIETQTALEELGLAIEAAREVGSDCILCSVSYDVTYDGSDVRTMMGVSPEQAAAYAEKAGAHVIGTNCGTGVDVIWAATILKRYRETCGLPLLAQPNAGNPRIQEGRTVYLERPEESAQGVASLVEAGANIVGACCGSSPDHIRSIRKALDVIRK